MDQGAYARREKWAAAGGILQKEQGHQDEEAAVLDEEICIHCPHFLRPETVECNLSQECQKPPLCAKSW